MKLVVAIDGEPSAKTALEYMAKEKYDKETEALLVHVIVPGFADAKVEGIPDVREEERTEEKAVLKGMTQSLNQLFDIEAKTAIKSGEIAEVIAQTCKEFAAEQVIVPSHARQGFSRIWFGSVADEIVDAAPCTVIVLKMPHPSKSQ